jgi:hypothetical protein
MITRTTGPKMTVRKGKFYLGDKEVSIEHGNKEQIALLKRIEEMQDGFEPDISVRKIVVMEFDCVCGARNEFNSFSELDEYDPDTMIKGETDTCHYCGLLFKVIVTKTQYSEYLSLKLIPKEDEKLRKGPGQA